MPDYSKIEGRIISDGMLGKALIFSISPLDQYTYRVACIRIFPRRNRKKGESQFFAEAHKFDSCEEPEELEERLIRMWGRSCDVIKMDGSVTQSAIALVENWYVRQMKNQPYDRVQRKGDRITAYVESSQ